MKRKELDDMANHWPSTLVARSQVKSFSGGAISGKTLANLDSLGLGVPDRFKIGRQVVYPVQSLIRWLESQCK